MGAAEHERISADEFLEWVSGQEGRFELVDGYVVEMMAGAKQGHNVVVTNIVSSVGPQAKASGCRTTASDTAIRTLSSSIRYPDIVVDCGPPDPEATVAAHPTLVIEVSSPGTSLVGTTDKLDEYQLHPPIRLIMLVEPGIVSAKVYRRDAQGRWHSQKYDDLDDVIDMPEIGTVLSMSDIYYTLAPRHPPRLRLIGTADAPQTR